MDATSDGNMQPAHLATVTMREVAEMKRELYDPPNQENLSSLKRSNEALHNYISEAMNQHLGKILA